MSAGLTLAQVLTLIRRRARAAGGLRALARRLGVSPAALADVLQHRRPPGPTLLRALRLRRRVRYVRERR